MRNTIADQIHELLADEQPEECRRANLLMLAHALKATGPVIHQGQVVSVAGDGDIDFDLTRAIEEFSGVPTPNGTTTVDTSLIPDDAELARKWNLPLASETPFVRPETPPAQPG